MYDELVKDLRENHDKYFARDMQAADAIEELQQVAAHYEETAKDYFKDVCYYLERVPRWIPVTERLPNAHELVLIYNPGYLMTTGFIYEDGRWRVRSVDYPDTPTHWMPLPEPPKEE